MFSRATSPIAVAALGAELASTAQGAPTEVRMLPAGMFRSGDGSGRPNGLQGWVLNGARADQLIAAAAARASDYVIDYEHQTLNAATNGQPAPASGWFKKLEYRASDTHGKPAGLYAVDVRWTAQAAAMIVAGEYRYFSPVFAYDEKTGEVLAIAHAGLTNNPGLDGLTDLSAALTALSAHFPSLYNPEKDAPMLKLLVALGLAATATEDEALAALNALKANHTAALTAATGAQPDPAKFVPIAALTSVQGELATTSAELVALKAKNVEAEVDGVVKAALAAGKLTPALGDWARDLGKRDLAALKAYVDAAAPGIVPGTTQSGGSGGGVQSSAVAALTADQVVICQRMNIKPEDFKSAQA